MAETYVYKPLGASEIRLLRISTKRFSRSIGRDEELFCELNASSLDDATDTYAALSYTWGAMGVVKPIVILVEGRESSCLIQTNLYDALLALQLEDQDRLVWADAVCINQSDDIEKSTQVQQMQQVYQRAAATMVWLGNAADDSDLAFDCMRDIGEMYKEGVQKDDWPKMLAKINTRNDTEATFPCDAMTALFSRSWFSRIWVVQEISVAKGVVFCCGQQSIEETPFLLSARLLQMAIDTAQKKVEKTGYERRLIQSLRRSPMTILFHLPCHVSHTPKILKEWLEDCHLSNYGNDRRLLKATDPRDLIFAILGIASDTNSLGLRSDYTRTVPETYIEATKAFLHNGDFGILGFVEHPRTSLDLPSWVPDWRLAPISFPLQHCGGDPGQNDPLINIQNSPWANEDYRSFSASGSTRPTIEFHDAIDGGSALSLLSIVFGTVKDTAAVLAMNETTELTYDSILQMIRDITSLIETTNSNLYPTQDSQEEAILRTMITDRSILPTVGRCCCRARSSHLRPLRTVLEELAKPDIDHELFEAAHLGFTDTETIAYSVSLRLVTATRKPFITSEGWIGMGPECIEDGDIIAVPLGAKVPYILRVDENGKYRLKGEVYVHGIMDGEILQMGLPVVTIKIH